MCNFVVSKNQLIVAAISGTVVVSGIALYLFFFHSIRLIYRRYKNNKSKEYKEKYNTNCEIGYRYYEYVIIIVYKYNKQKEYEEALLYYKNALEYSTTNKQKSSLNGLIGCCYYENVIIVYKYNKQKEYEEALPYFKTALEYSTTDEVKYTSIAKIGNCYYFTV